MTLAEEEDPLWSEPNRAQPSRSPPPSFFRPSHVAIHSGTPTGSFSTVHGLKTYIASPEGGSKDKTVVFLSDIFGIELVNTQLVCDEWAKQGYYVLLPDILGGSAVPHELLNAIAPNLREKETQTVVEKA